MANLNTMYPGVANSPDTYLREPLASGGSILYVVEGLVFGTLPTLAVIGDDHTAETVLVTAKRADNGYDITRAIEGNAKDWIKGTTVARNFTNYDYEQIRQNFEILNTTKAELIDGKVNPTQLPADKDTTYTAGTNVTITGTTISATDTLYDDTALETRITAVENREDKDTTYDVATTSENGLMSSTDKTKLDEVETGAEKNTITSVQGRTGAVTISKSDVGLSNVDNIKQMPISGGVLENYREKLTTVSASDGSINLSLGNVFVHTPSGSRTYSITNAVSGVAHSFTLIINMGSTVRTLTFPGSVKWQGGEIPDLSTASKTYVLTFMTIDGGTNWLGMFGGEF